MNGGPSDERGMITSLSVDWKHPDDLPDELREDPHALRNFVRHAPFPLAMFDREMCYVAVSRPWTELFQTGDSETPGRSHYDVFPDLPERWREAHRQGMQGKSLGQAEDAWTNPNGTSAWHRWNVVPWHSAQGEIGGIVLFIENISTPKAIDDVLRLISIDAAGVDFNAFAKHAVRRLSEIMGAEMVQLAVPCTDDPGRVETIAVFADGEPAPNYSYDLAGTPCDIAIKRKICLYNDGISERFPEDHDLKVNGIKAYAGSALLNAKGQILGILSVMSRTSFGNPELVRAAISLAGVGIGGLLESHRAKAAIEASEQFSRGLLDTMNSHIAVLDEAGRIIFANQAWFNYARENGADEKSAGIGASYLAACDAGAAASPEATLAARLLREVLSGQKSEGSFEYPCPTPQGMSWYRCIVKSFANPERTMVLLAHENVTDIKQAQRRSEQVEQKFRHLFENAPDAALITDGEGVIRLANRQAEQMFDHDRGSLEGLPIRSLVHHIDAADLDAFMEELTQRVLTSVDGTAWATVVAHRGDGGTFPAEVSVSRFVENDETYFIVALRDVSLRLAAEADRLARQLAEQANQAKSVFLATMSHEIRTPLNAVLGFAEILSHSTLDDDQKGLLQHMHSSARHLLGLIDNVLDLSKIEADELTLEHEAVDLSTLILDNARALSGQARKRNVQINLFIAPDLPRKVMSDPSRLRQVAYNLLGNAIKFSGGRDTEGRVVVRAQLSADAVPMFEMTVQDNGIGMSEEVAARVFQPFVQGESTITRRFGGTGLGLAISKRIVERMGGTITVDSAPGSGSTFRVAMPLEPAPYQPAPVPPRLKGLHCLLADSKAYLADDLACYLQHEGAQVTRLAPGNQHEDTLPPAPAADVLIAGEDFSPPILLTEAPSRILISGTGPDALDDGRSTAVWLRSELLTCDALVRAVQRACGHGLRVGPEGPVPARDDGAEVPKFDAGRYQPILVVEDDPMNQKVILRQLALLGLGADLADDGAAALAMLRKKRYGLILADLHMPVMDGYAMARAHRKHEAENGIDIDGSVSIVALTANVLREEIGNTREAGFDGFLTKPATLKQLASTIAAFLPLADTRRN